MNPVQISTGSCNSGCESLSGGVVDLLSSEHFEIDFNEHDIIFFNWYLVQKENEMR